ncbi:unnamed protein product [Spirodela intermedia]|uniref:Glycosyltransferase n=1 Tax=Spirodela intermedia TaxID=51605 RepID=A0ABN7EC31_SPIIN|nr:unnamed protein product [Spirodela intermedia]
MQKIYRVSCNIFDFSPDGSPEWIPFPSTIAFRGFEARELFRSGAERDISGVSEAIRFGVAISDCQIVAVRSCPELEPNWLNLLTEIYGRRSSRWGIFEWLDAQEAGSVLYAAFGSEVKLSRGELQEIALGWRNLSFPSCGLSAGRPGTMERERLDGRGLVCEEWLPQVRILAHRGIGVEVPRDEVDGSFTADGISQALRLVMASPEGGPIRSIARESKATFGDEELHDEHLTRFIEYLVEHRRAPP